MASFRGLNENRVIGKVHARTPDHAFMVFGGWALFTGVSHILAARRANIYGLRRLCTIVQSASSQQWFDHPGRAFLKALV
jgi:hypothetical protein